MDWPTIAAILGAVGAAVGILVAIVALVRWAINKSAQKIARVNMEKRLRRERLARDPRSRDSDTIYQ